MMFCIEPFAAITEPPWNVTVGNPRPSAMDLTWNKPNTTVDIDVSEFFLTVTVG